ncbi:unnamed protein product, partial [Ectocarpus sp. 8 AP-2014]
MLKQPTGPRHHHRFLPTSGEPGHPCYGRGYHPKADKDRRTAMGQWGAEDGTAQGGRRLGRN